MKNKIKITVNFYPEQFGIMKPNSWQEKTFKDEASCMEWCRRNSKKIGCINDYRTFGQPISHFDIMNAIRGVSN